MKRTLLTSAMILALAACDKPAENTQVSTSEASSTAAETSPANHQQAATDRSPELGEWGVDIAQMDTNVEPGDDFARYASGKWLDTFEIPADRASYGIFTSLRERSTEQVNQIINDLADESPAADTLEQKVGDYYASWMDVGALNEKGANPLETHLNNYRAIDNETELMRALGDIHATAPFGIGILPDPADTTKYTLFAGQAGLGMPDREYYLSEEERFVEFREAYHAYMVKIQELAGIEDAEAKADAIMALETELAKVHWTPAESRDIQKIYNPMSPAQLAELAPQINWNLILTDLGLNNVPSIVVAQPSAIEASGKIFAETPIETWKDYLSYHFIRTNAANLSEAFDKTNFEFFGKTLNGIEAQRERWKRGSDLVNANLGEAVGRIYVDRHFPPEAKEQMDELVANLRVALSERIKVNQWMDDETKQNAQAKLDTFEPRIGYTKKWIDYSNLTIKKGDMLGNALRLTGFQWQRQVEKLDGPVDREEWPYPPQTVNASYNPLLNQITFPAGILQPPFFDPNADPAVNYGAIGGVIGHEIGHGFDDQGRRFDETGNLRDWWTPTADENFKQRSDALVEQYNSFEPIEGMNVDGRLTLGENIGDLGGLEMAYSAYQHYKEENGEPPVLDGMTGDQRFFMAWAQVWRAKAREDALRQQLLTDPHSPPQYRINGVVRNIDAWYDAFNVTADDELYLPPEERVRIW